MHTDNIFLVCINYMQNMMAITYFKNLFQIIINQLNILNAYNLCHLSIHTHTPSFVFSQKYICLFLSIKPKTFVAFDKFQLLQIYIWIIFSKYHTHTHTQHGNVRDGVVVHKDILMFKLLHIYTTHIA